MKNLFWMSGLLLLSVEGFAVCEDVNLQIEVNVSEGTFDKSYYDYKIPFSEEDSVKIVEKKTGKTVLLKDALFENDGAGNFTVCSPVQEECSIETAGVFFLDHDHETWYQDGLSGFYSGTDGKVYDLSTLFCSFEDLFGDDL